MDKKLTYRIDGMHCSGCAGTVHNALIRNEGVKEAQVSHEGGVATIRHTLTDTEIEEIIRGAGYRLVRTD
ncbi:MAG: heavy-metal-associated domain-containing protein [Balneolales bacterium]